MDKKTTEEEKQKTECDHGKEKCVYVHVMGVLGLKFWEVKINEC